MTANFDADNSANWVQIFNDSYQVSYIQGKATKVYVPIPPTDLAVNIDSPLIAVHCTSTDYPHSQRYLGSIVQQVKLPGVLPTTTALGRGKGLYSNQTVLAKFTEFDDSYSLLLRPKYYVEQLTITIYKYTGSTYFVLEERLNTIDAKVEQILEKVDSNGSGNALSTIQKTIGSIFTNFL